MCKTKRTRLYVSSSGEIHEDWETSSVSWASLCWDKSYKESLNEAWRMHNWSHAFAIVDFFDKGFFTVHVIQIIDGKTSLWGELITGK